MMGEILRCAGVVVVVVKVEYFGFELLLFGDFERVLE